MYMYTHVTYRTYPTIASVLMLNRAPSIIAYLFLTLTYIALQEYSYPITPISSPFFFSLFSSSHPTSTHYGRRSTNYRFNNTSVMPATHRNRCVILTNHSAVVKRDACVFLINSRLSSAISSSFFFFNFLHYQDVSFSPNVVYVSTVTHTLYIAYMVQRK